jgi:hypothetical protein
MAKTIDQLVAMLKETQLNNILPHTLSEGVGNIVRHCYDRTSDSGVNNIVDNYTKNVGIAQHCSILF